MSAWRSGRQATAFDYALPPDAHKTLVQTGAQFEAMLRRIYDADIVIYDFETTGLRWAQGARPCGLALGRFLGEASGEVDAWYVPFRHRGLDVQLDYALIAPALRDVLGDPHSVKCAHNHVFDAAMARVEGWPVRGPRFCTLIAAHLHDEHQPLGLKHRAKTDLGDPRGLLWEQHLDFHIARQAKLYGAGIREYKARLGYSEVPIAICGRYACWDVAYCAGLYHRYVRTERMAERYPRVVGNEMALIEVIEDMERVGMPVDADYVVDLQKRLQAAQVDTERRIWAALPGVRHFELSQDDALRRLLCDQLKLPLSKRTKNAATDTLSVDAEVLGAFCRQAPVLGDILEWREAQKLLSTYTASLLDHLDANGVVHPSFKSAGTKTGRLSCAAPNIQNMPGDSKGRALRVSGKELRQGGKDPLSVRRAFVVPDGYVRLYFDYSQIELRVLTWYTRDPILVDSYTKGEDVHKRTAREIFGTDDDEHRSYAKSINFGLVYGMGAGGVARASGISLEKASAHLTRYFEKYARIQPYRTRFWRRTREARGTFHNAWGRRHQSVDLDSTNPYARAKAERTSFAALVQGTAAELTKESMVRIWRHLRATGSGARIVNTIHDEVQVDCPLSEAATLVPWLRHHMESYPEFAPVPILVSGRMALHDWSEAYDDAALLPGFGKS